MAFKQMIGSDNFLSKDIPCKTGVIAMKDESRHSEEGRTLVLTGASRGIGHATVKRFSSAGWRVITCSRHAFPENCPRGGGPGRSHPG